MRENPGKGPSAEQEAPSRRLGLQRRLLLHQRCVCDSGGGTQQAMGAPVSGEACSYLSTDLSRNADKLGIGGKGGQVFHSFNERSSGGPALVAILF